jgi:DNA-binding PadR family transcriptional regulator
MYIDILVLALLLERPRHGYEIKQQITAIVGNFVSVNNNQLYPALRRFEELGAITREIVHTPGKPDRHVYHMTDRGTEILQDLLRDFSPEQARDELEFQVRVAYFHLVEVEARLAILAAREAILSEWRVMLDRSLAQARESSDISPLAESIIEFKQQTIQHELDWIAHLRQEVHV